MTWQWKSIFRSTNACKKEKPMTYFHYYIISVVWKSIYNSILNNIFLLFYFIIQIRCRLKGNDPTISHAKNKLCQ